jgi:hypothetical protein
MHEENEICRNTSPGPKSWWILDYPNASEALDWSNSIKTLDPRARNVQRMVSWEGHTTIANQDRTCKSKPDPTDRTKAQGWTRLVQVNRSGSIPLYIPRGRSKPHSSHSSLSLTLRLSLLSLRLRPGRKLGRTAEEDEDSDESSSSPTIWCYFFKIFYTEILVFLPCLRIYGYFHEIMMKTEQIGLWTYDT